VNSMYRKIECDRICFRAVGEFGRPSRRTSCVAASVERVDKANQEITLKRADGSLETIMVANPEYVRPIKVGDRVLITGARALALSTRCGSA
jgi:hypothetical protein